MILETRTLDQAIEWLLPKIGTKKETILNDHSGEQVDAVSALCVWCLRLRYNLVEHGYKNGVDSRDYPAWNGYRSIASENIYATIEAIAKDYRMNGGVLPDYSERDHKDISKWTYKRVFGPDIFVPIHVDVEELWFAVQNMFPEFIGKQIEEKEKVYPFMDRMNVNFLEFEMNNNALANILNVM